jgi:hypothetical protein
MKARTLRILKLVLLYAAVALGLLWLDDPGKVSMNAAASTVKFVYQQF